MDLPTSKTYANARQLSEWTLEDDATLQAKLILAADYLAEHYNFKATFTPSEQAKYDAAHFKVAYDFLVRGNPATREERFTTVEINELAGVGKTEKEFAEVEYDPYPGLTKLLAPLLVSSAPTSASFGKLVR